MKNPTILNAKTTSLIADFLKRYEIRSMHIDRGLGITNSTEISNINIMFIKVEADESLDYSVQFKLQSCCADSFQYLKSIKAGAEPGIELNSRLTTKDSETVNYKLQSFIDLIRERVISAQKEEKVQNISYVGNIFILNNSTKFKVLSDEGEGRLNIELLSTDKPLDAMLTASGLLDGLYLGSIKLVREEEI
jgi:hypothetical protein